MEDCLTKRHSELEGERREDLRRARKAGEELAGIRAEVGAMFHDNAQTRRCSDFAAAMGRDLATVPEAGVNEQGRDKALSR